MGASVGGYGLTISGLWHQAPWYPRPPPPRVRQHLPPQEDRPARIWWIALRQLRPGPHCPRFLDRGAEGRQEGAQGVTTEEALSGQQR